jgi:antitoxin ParD1/3/4/toxin ParE1/3/4
VAKWVLSPLAQGDLIETLEYVAEESASLEVAERLLSDLEAAFVRLEAMPRMGSLRKHLTGNVVRWWPVRGYLVVYDPSAKPLRILRVIHGARDLERIFRSYSKR